MTQYTCGVNEVDLNERKARVARAFIVSFTAVFVAALSHVVAGGNIPSWIGVGAAVIIALPLTLALTKRSFGLTGVFIAVASTQAIFHGMFAFMVLPTGGSGGPVPAHAHCNIAETFIPVLPVTAGSTGSGIAMVAAHGVAALITVWLIRRGDVALTRLSRVLSRVFWPTTQLTGQVAGHPPACTLPVSTAHRVTSFISAHIGFSVSHRGPPVLA